jgi:hypothetical protein
MPLTPTILAPNRLSDETRDAMLALHTRHFENVRRQQFMADLGEKDWVILLRDEGGGIAGFSTQQLIPLALGGVVQRYLFSGDTIVDPVFRNTPLLPGCFGHIMLRLMDDYGEDNLHWFLISKGFRTYRFLPVFFNRFWPAPGVATPPAITVLLNAVARHKFGDHYDAPGGIIRPPDGDRLAAAAALIPPLRNHDPYIAHFLALNPGYARGDELACLAPIRRDNLNARARRVIQATTPVWEC